MPLNVLITGHAGFIGKHLATRLQALDCRVSGIDAYEPRVHRSVNLSLSPESMRCADAPGWKLAEADVVVHLAAQVGVADSMHVPLRYLHDNTMDTARFLENLAGLRDWSSWRLRRLIVASSMSVYGDPLSRAPVSEMFPVRPASVYGLTKYDQEQLCLLFGQRTGVTVVALRLWNVYGPGQALHNPYTGALANFATAYLRSKPPTIYEDGQQTRDFIYINDVVDAFAFAATTLSGPGGIYNVATGIPHTILYAAERLGAALGSSVVPRVTGEKRLGDIRHCIGNSERFQEAYDWYPLWPFERGIGEYAFWLAKEYGPASMPLPV